MEQAEILSFLSQNIQQILTKANLDFEKLQEIRLRCYKPLILVLDGREKWFDSNGKITNDRKKAYQVSPQDIKETMEYVSDYSIYAYEEEIRQGFLTIRGGHRVGLAGRVVSEGDQIKGMKHISNINIRISHEKKGCADKILPWLFEKKKLCHTLLISGPGCGKTTMLRDLIRQISDGSGSIPGYTVGVVDERSEIAGCYNGIPQNDVGIRTDVLDCCPKAEGMMLLIRSMSPDIIAVDELGCKEDIHAIETAIHCGCKLLATVHGTSIEDIRRKPLFDQLIRDQVFERYVVLHNREQIGRVRAIFNQNGNCIFGECG